MDKETQLRALRELTGANASANTANKAANSDANAANKPDVSKPARSCDAADDIAVMKYLDGLRRKATSIEEVDVIDAIVKALFYEGVNKVTGRVHGRPSPLNDQEKSPETGQEPEEKPKTDRNAYQREYMRKRRAAQQGG
jgi:hypothetical protein